MHDGLMSTFHSPVTPPELARELGHTDGGRKLRNYLRKTHPDHFKNQRWMLTPEHAADARAHFRGQST